ncbi:TonB-dependent receptor [Aestuariibacter sp. AA17]|uniref:TonB-dependent receptor n=1 Tax=Fluctibacter corallii TaxID=2984329 RepID=A0ABT3A969_9ALTE|nr:TonB-dependent receptor [Aestuariibacter sp. AA17]MCV2884866.1 TonB-dependent receptor [Aestuariibacter sp. AA17]
MHRSRLSYIAALVIASVSGNTFAEQASVSSPAESSLKNSSEALEKITVYGRHNALILNSGTATKSNMSLMDTPAAIVVVDKTLLDQQNAFSLQDALRNVSGLGQAGNNYGIGDNLVVRGLGVNYAYDGMFGGADLENSYNPTRSLTNVESIEVLKGPATGLYGIGAAGGVINLVEKKPLFQSQTLFSGTIGEWDHTRLMVDNTGPINDKLAYRVVAAHEQEDGYRDLGNERAEVYGSLKFNASDTHEFLFSAAYIDDKVQIDSIGHPVRILNRDSLAGEGDEITADRLVNDSDADNDKKLGIQLTDAQREQLAASINDTDGVLPLDLGATGLISPLSRPNAGEEVRIKVRHDVDFSAQTKLRHQFQYREYDSNFVRQTGAYNYVYWNRYGEINAEPRAPLEVDGVLYPYAARRQEYRKQEVSETTLQYFADLQSTWSWGAFEGEHLLSVNYENRDMSVMSWSAYDADGSSGDNPIPYILDIRSPNWPTGRFEDYDTALRTNYDKEVSAYGISAQEVLYFDEKLTARIGVAYSAIEQKYQHKGTDRAPEASAEADTDDSGLTYNLGLNYSVTENVSTFVNYAKGRTAYSILGAVDGEDDRPDSESKSFDIGVRFTAFDEDLLGSFVWFETRRTNLRYGNELYNDNPEDPEFNVSVPQYFYDDEDNSEGFEFDLNFALMESWSMNLNYTRQDAINIRSQERLGQTKGVPKHMGGVWTEYTMPINLLNNPISFRLGADYVGERTINSTSFGLPDAVINSYVVWDAGISYQAEEWDVQLNINNLFDKTYYSKAMFLGGLPGEERNISLTVNYRL